MVTPRQSSATPHRLAQQARERFVLDMDRALLALGSKVQLHLSSLTTAGRFGSVAESRLALDTVAAFRREHDHWVAQSRQQWQATLGRVRDAGSHSGVGALGLVDDEVVERKIIASRLASAVIEAAGSDLNDLRIRVQRLERVSEWGRHEVFPPETLAQILVQAWTGCGLTRPMWGLIQAPVNELLCASMAQAYRQANEFLVDQGVMAEIDMKSRVRRSEDDGGEGGPAGAGGAPVAQSGRGYSGAMQGYAGDGPVAGRAPVPSDFGHQATARSAGVPTASWYGAPIAANHSPGQARSSGAAGPATQTPTVQASALARASQETRMMTGVTPMARVRQRAQGVLGQLRRLISDRVADFDETAAVGAPSPRLARALGEQVTPFATTEWVSRPGAPGGSVTQPLMEVERVATQLRRRASDLKEKAEKPSEKAIIEIVALMFQAILAEERIPASIRVWFARLQIPVLRLALAEPDFFASIQHPARQLIDRMGACVLGFDGSQVLGNRLEREVKRVVQVIEQYPETGRRVYQLVLDEFKKFLGRSLSDTGAVQQAATLAQQVEQKEALSIQYTIELRRMLDPVPVADEVREFLFRVWSEVLALAAVRHGAQHAQTLSLKQAAADLLWAVSPKPDREERRRVVQQLSSLLQALRGGMTMLAMPEEEQDGHIKLVNDAVMAAFVSRDEGLPQEKLDDLARGLAGLEDVVTDDPEGDLLLDPGMIELMFGVDESALEVIAAGGSLPSDGMLEWARALELGAWFSLELNGAVVQVQYVWRSARGQLHLFSAGVGKSYLVQTRRMAAYLQAGLLVPIEDEALTVRATREALAKLNADPERLLH
ncbi:DUF1631 domain-containing protein [Ottowia sp. GY511]|uniref:DUF1631 family protein n=1 Tax=Ottowia flava TaxID=2675430 RepID=A0ABW4KT18_9BURK|nr:DUF1631 family protein [Ottowia sp. GY511]TXK31052.1 DUF1631 domain-containing protein [Ottowia sp. GY511]